MLKRPTRNETEDDILRMQEEFFAEKAKNPKLQPAAQIVNVARVPKKSLFARRLKNNDGALQDLPVGSTNASAATTACSSDISKGILNEINEKIIGNVRGNNSNTKTTSIAKIVLGDVVEKHFDAPKQSEGNTKCLEAVAFPKVKKIPHGITPKKDKSIFAQSMEVEERDVSKHIPPTQETDAMDCDNMNNRQQLDLLYGSSSAIVDDSVTAADVHSANLELLSQMKREEILAERKKLLDAIDPSLVALLAKRRQDKAAGLLAITKQNALLQENASTSMDCESDDMVALPPSNPAVELLERGNAEHWIHFDVVEKHKLDWMRDIPQQAVKLKPGEKFEARFDWKGVLLPYSTNDTETINAQSKTEKDERELYLHGDEPHRPGYTLQELFRLARSNVMQQRISSFGAIAGILNIYNQGFYDHVLDLPITKIFFLLRFGLDDNTPAMLEVVAKALAYLFYNETDETLLDFIYDNPGCHWQPTLQVAQSDVLADEDPTSIENLQKQMKQLHLAAGARSATATIKASVEESEDESKTAMSDFQLAETDLIDCLLRTNILQRIYFILHTVRPDNTTVSSCLKLLIRLARAGKSACTDIVENAELLTCLWKNFLPGLERIDTTLQTPPFYNYPQYLCLKLIRVLISQNLGVAIKLINFGLVDKLQNYLYNNEDIKSKLIKVQIECLRILRCLLLLRLDNTLYKKFLPAFRYMLEWHFHHVNYEVGGPFLIRQHAAALLAAITSGTGGLEASSLLGDTLHDCCCSWFHKATRSGVKEFSQATLLSACLNAVSWHTRHCDPERFRNFNSKYLPDYVNSEGFARLTDSLVSSCVLLRKSRDRRNAHPPLPNVGAVLLHDYGPQLIVPQQYAVHLLAALCRLLELQLERGQRTLFEALTQPRIMEPLVQYLRDLCANMDPHLATNFYAKSEVLFTHKLLFLVNFGAYFDKAQMLQLVYNFLCCLTAEHVGEIEQLFERVIFNTAFLNVDAETLQKWRRTCLELVYSHSIVLPATELSLSLPYTQVPILPSDWPYFQLKIILQNYIDNVQQKPVSVFSEGEVLRMTFTFVAQLEERNSQLQIVTPTEKLMYLMIAFMGPDSQFLDAEMQQLLRAQLLGFYTQCRDHFFQFDAVYEDKCKFENLYALFVDHFQAASYGNELFASLVLVPLAQKYDNKWRRRLWSDYASALSFLNCDESLLIGGLQAYLEPPEQEDSLIKAYITALNTNLLRSDTIPYKIAKHHVEKYKEKLRNK